MKIDQFIVIGLLAVIAAACSGAETAVQPTLPAQDDLENISYSQENNRVEKMPADSNGSAEILEPVQTGGMQGVAYYLFAPLRETTTYLIDQAGTAVYTWESSYTPGNAVYLLEDGSLLRTGSTRTEPFATGGAGGIVEQIAPDGSVVWSFSYASEDVLLHHDIELLPDGNILMIAWEMKTAEEAVAAGRDGGTVSEQGLWPDHLIEVDLESNQIVWEWHVWDHLIQDVDPVIPNYGVVSEYPEKIDINYVSGRANNPDFNHINAVDYNAELDQILLSVHSFNEIWIIDHNTTTEEAAGDAGDLLYRWGNPQAYGQGTAADQVYFGQHDAQWVPAGLPGGGNILVFNNGIGRSGESYSELVEIAPPLQMDGSYLLANNVYGPEAPLWTYVAENPTDFYSQNISGVQRLANGNTLVCSGTGGVFFEVTPGGEIVWEYTYGGAVFDITGLSAGAVGVASLSLNPTTQVVGEAGGAGPSGAGPNGAGQPAGQPSGPGRPAGGHPVGPPGGAPPTQP